MPETTDPRRAAEPPELIEVFTTHAAAWKTTPNPMPLPIAGTVLDRLREDVATLGWFKARFDSVLQLCAGKPSDYLMMVSEILAAAGMPAADGQPLSLTWDGIVMGPSDDTPRENTLVPTTTPFGVQAFLVLDDERRLALGNLLLAGVPTEECRVLACGLPDGLLDTEDPRARGMIRVDVAGSTDGGSWWCSPACASAAITAAGNELAAADRTAAAAPASTEDDVDQRYGPGAGDEYALQMAEAAAAALEEARGYDDDDTDDSPFYDGKPDGDNPLYEVNEDDHPADADDLVDAEDDDAAGGAR